jgi:hypothetical protein
MTIVVFNQEWAKLMLKSFALRRAQHEKLAGMVLQMFNPINFPQHTELVIPSMN